MLKLLYTEVGLFMERVLAPLELTIAQRVVLAMRLGQTLHVEPGRAAFLLPAQITVLKELQEFLLRADNRQVSVTSVDLDYVEVSVTGSWVSAHEGADEGMLLTVLSDELEATIYQLWQASQRLLVL